MDGFVGFGLSVLSSLVAVAIMLMFERKRRPSLAVQIEPVPVRREHDGAVFLRVRVWNRPMWRPLTWVYERQPALACRGRITFFNMDKLPVFGPHRSMVGRWSSTPDPYQQVVFSDGTMLRIADPSLSPAGIDIAPGTFEVMDVVMRNKGADDCLGWSNSFILSLLGVKPPLGGDPWILGRGRYYVLIELLTGGRRLPCTVRLVNDTALNDFRLEPLGEQLDLPVEPWDRLKLGEA